VECNDIETSLLDGKGWTMSKTYSNDEYSLAETQCSWCSQVQAVPSDDLTLLLPGIVGRIIVSVETISS
jgi:hypothetical protein